MYIQSNLNCQLLSLLVDLSKNTRKILWLASGIWMPHFFYFIISYDQFGLSSTVMILGPNQYYFFHK